MHSNQPLFNRKNKRGTCLRCRKNRDLATEIRHWYEPITSRSLLLNSPDTYPSSHVLYMWTRDPPVVVLDKEMAQFYMKALSTTSRNLTYVAGRYSSVYPCLQYFLNTTFFLSILHSMHGCILFFFFFTEISLFYCFEN